MNRFRFCLPEAEEITGDVVRQLGYPPDRPVRADVREGIEEAAREGIRLLRPRWAHGTTELVSWGDGFVVGRDLRIRSRRWASLVGRLEGPERIVCFVVTAGIDLDRAIRQRQAERLFRAYLLDAVGSVLVERLTDQVQRALSEWLRAEGLDATDRFSPGYCDWELKAGQEGIFRLLGTETAGVERTSTGMMIPAKSVSAALIGARDATVRVPCPFCPREDCTYRKAPSAVSVPDGGAAGEA